jgi:hypothetical protein
MNQPIRNDVTDDVKNLRSHHLALLPSQETLIGESL